MTSFVSLTTIILQFLLLSASSELSKSKNVACNEKDRQILVVFKQGLHDPFNWLSSWSTEDDCCKWTGIQCDNITGKVTKLSLPGDFSDDGSNNLEGEINLFVLLKLEFLKYLDLSQNNFTSIYIPVDSHTPQPHANFSSIHYLDLSYNSFLSMNSLDWLSYVSSVKYLNLAFIDLHHETSWLESVTMLPSLLELSLRGCQLKYIRPPLGWYFNSTSLEFLDLSQNILNSEIFKWVSKLSSLSHLSLESILLKGVVSGEHFANLSKLKILDLSSSNFVFHWDPKWIPPFQLQYVYFQYSTLGPIFPAWLYTQRSMIVLNISTSRISSVDHDKFWKMAGTISGKLDLSGNSIGGDISNVIINTPWIELENNNFSGELPRISPNVTIIIMFNNSFSGSISSLLCHGMNEKNNLQILNISYNFLSGELPSDCWLCWKSLLYLNLESNNLMGKIPDSMGLLPNLQSLHLHRNRFFGEIPTSLQNNNKLVLLDLEGNNFSGSLPIMVGQNMKALVLRSNQFSGVIPLQICQLASLIILDLADNRLSGPIPKCLSNISAMVSEEDSMFENYIPIYTSFTISADALSLLIKGQEGIYNHYLELVHLIDLSSNDLSGLIPAELFHLSTLQSLNLSRNQLTGKLPPEIGGMKNLESLDLSRNLLSGEIPQSMSKLNFLGVLNLSYNHFRGKIPIGTQLQSFDEYTYIGNSELCGIPLKKGCVEEKTHDGAGELQENEDKSEQEGFYMGMGVGFATSFWAVCIALFFKRSWRHAYFRFLNDIKDRLYVMAVLKMNCFH